MLQTLLLSVYKKFKNKIFVNVNILTSGMHMLLGQGGKCGCTAIVGGILWVVISVFLNVLTFSGHGFNTLCESLEYA